MADPIQAATAQSIGILARRIRELENQAIAESANAAISIFFADLPVVATSKRGWLRYVRNGRKVGEGAGVGTGCLAYCDGVQWRRSSDDTTVAV